MSRRTSPITKFILAQAGRDPVHAKNRVRSATGGLIHSAKKADADQQQRVRQMDRERRLAVGTASQAQAHKDKFLGNGKQQGKYNKLSRKAKNLKRGLRMEQAAKKAEKRGGKGGGGKGEGGKGGVKGGGGKGWGGKGGGGQGWVGKGGGRGWTRNSSWR